jgi:hypothetical protein
MISMRCIVALGAVLAALMTAGAAQANPSAPGLSTSPAPSDAGFTVTATAMPTSGAEIWATYQQGGSCANGPDTSSGTPLQFNGTPVDASDTSFSDSTFQLLPGAYLFCSWVTDTSGTSSTTALPVNVASADSISLSETPTPVQGREFDLYAAGTNYDADGVLNVDFKAPGATCATNPLADTGTPANGNGEAAGKGAYSQDVGALMFLAPGTYLVCGWLYDQQYPSVVLAHAQQTLTVPKLSANLQITAPGTVARGNGANVSVSATLPSGVTVEVVVDAFSKHSHPTCPSRPPSNADSALDEMLTGTSQPVRASTTEPVTVTNSTLLCAWLLDGWSGSDSPAVVSGPVAATVSAAPPLTFRGHTAQHRSMSILTSPFASAIMGVQFGVHLRCNGTPRLLTGRPWNGVDKETISAFIFGHVKPDHSGRFKIRLTSNPRHTFTLKARISGKTIIGSFTETGRSWVFTQNHGQNLRCSSGSVKFSLRTP